LSLLGLVSAAHGRWRLAAQGAVSLTVGILPLLRSAITATALLYLLALSVIIMGAFRLHNAIQITDRVRRTSPMWELFLDRTSCAKSTLSEVAGPRIVW
jgi:uncharacterized membrane protein HdeD (DUF308 family)